MIDYLNCSCENRIRAYAIFLLANHCMPVLLQMKPSNLFNVSKTFISDSNDFFIAVSEEIGLFDCKYTVLYENATSYLVLIYQEECIEKIIHQEHQKAFLESYHYTLEGKTVANVVDELKDRYYGYRNHRMGFPHELGILLGYPLCDVIGFIKNSGKNYILCGFWKVYQDADKASSTFENYHRIREIAMREITAGKSLKDIKNLYRKWPIDE